MARAVAIETSGRIGSIAVADGSTLLAEEQFEHGLQHAVQIVPMLDRLVSAQGWKPRDIEHLYVSAGPGSFTGLRIGITFAKTMALATGVRIALVPTTRVLAENAPADARHLIIVLDAKRDQIFTARFERGDRGNWQEREAAHLDSLTAMLQRSPRRVHLLGEGIPMHRQFVPQDDVGVIITSGDCWRARASSVAKLGERLAGEGQFADPYLLTPIYIRKPEAEEKYDQGFRVR